jgi:hypothetical protein
MIDVFKWTGEELYVSVWGLLIVAFILGAFLVGKRS